MAHQDVETSLTRQGLLMTALGTPVLSGICVGAVVLIGRLWGTSQLDTVFWFGAAISGGFSLLALGTILRASLRVHRTGERGLNAALARWSPVLILVGGIAGVIIAGRIADNALDMRGSVHTSDCARVVSDDAIAACLPVMERCDLETRDGPGIVVDRNGTLSAPWPEGLDVPDSPTTRARMLCAWKALRAGEKSANPP